MARKFSQQKAALTRVMKPILAARVDGSRVAQAQIEKALAEIRRARDEWDSKEEPFVYGWPDDWARWQRALNDIPGYLWERLEDI